MRVRVPATPLRKADTSMCCAALLRHSILWRSRAPRHVLGHGRTHASFDAACSGVPFRAAWGFQFCGFMSAVVHVTRSCYHNHCLLVIVVVRKESLMNRTCLPPGVRDVSCTEARLVVNSQSSFKGKGNHLIEEDECFKSRSQSSSRSAGSRPADIVFLSQRLATEYHVDIF